LVHNTAPIVLKGFEIITMSLSINQSISMPELLDTVGR
jgi:hypothetical protein